MISAGNAAEPIDLTISKISGSHGGTYLEMVDPSEILEPVSKKMFIDSVPYYLKAGLTLQVGTFIFSPFLYVGVRKKCHKRHVTIYSFLLLFYVQRITI